MKLKEYIKMLQEINARYDKDLEVIVAGDDEGNFFQKIFSDPSVAEMKNEDLSYFEYDNLNFIDVEKEKINAVVLN